MKPEENFLQLNKKSWNQRTPVHVESEFYDVNGFLQGKSSLNNIEIELLGDLKNKSILHLQCHFGMDSISLSRLGGRVTGVDFSDIAIDKARELALNSEQNTRFICCDIYSLPDHLDEEFDIVFSSYGTIGWLPDMEKWAGIVSRFLKPGGQFVFVEFHPILWMYDNDFQKIDYSYFNKEAIVETETGSYANRNADLNAQIVSWNHSLDEVIGNLLKKDLRLVHFKEYDYSPYSCFSHMLEFEPGKFRFQHFGNKLPMLYSLVVEKAF